MSDLELIERLCLSAVLGAVLGFEREWRQKNAGLKTNILIALGSTLFTLMSIDLSASAGGDATRIASQIVTGIGFLGAGAIIRTGATIRGLTTAAMIWVNASIGVAVGGGEYRLAIIATGVTLVVLLVMTPLEKWMDRKLKNRPAGEEAEDAAPPAAGPTAVGPSGVAFEPAPESSDDRPPSRRR
ncbi:MAG TPA: MgtC/SapB family protein [Vicinamibacterales bacterium]|nr:MgtC/SapB family protein [Vicinamibacterales bacterium]